MNYIRKQTSNLFEKLQRYKINKKTGCWEWDATRQYNRYGQLSIDGKTLYAHRVMAELFIKPIGRFEIVHHKCENKCCINPEHLMVIQHSKHMKLHYTTMGIK